MVKLLLQMNALLATLQTPQQEILWKGQEITPLQLWLLRPQERVNQIVRRMHYLADKYLSCQFLKSVVSYKTGPHMRHVLQCVN